MHTIVDTFVTHRNEGFVLTFEYIGHDDFKRDTNDELMIYITNSSSGKISVGKTLDYGINYRCGNYCGCNHYKNVDTSDEAATLIADYVHLFYNE